MAPARAGEQDEAAGRTELRAMREAHKTAIIYLARARYAEAQAERFANETERTLWLESAREYRALMKGAAKEKAPVSPSPAEW